MHDAQRCLSLRQALLGRAPAPEGLPELRRRAHRDQRAPPRDQGRLRPGRRLPGEMNKLLVAVEEQSYRPPTKLTRQAVPDQGVAAGGQGDDPALDLQQLRAARRLPHRAAHRISETRQALGQPGQRPLCQARRERQAGWQDGPLAADDPPRPRLPPQGLQGRRALGLPPAEPSGLGRPATTAGRRHSKR